MPKQRAIELLAPAKNLECGIEAINHGADAVYIGAVRFGARAAAGNSLEDIEKLVTYAHLYRVRIYVTLNTILRDDELEATEQLVWQLYRIGVDALIVQDMALLRLNLPPIPLHASTQMDNRTPEKTEALYRLGFQQVVLARELDIDAIRNIHAKCPVPLEVFVHGALCVSYSGQCYVSQHCFGRSANRGECAQFCRLKFDLTDSEGRIIQQGKHLLSLKDMNRSNELEELLDAGVTSFKIEGRLKDKSYVKNITAFYRRRLDAILKRRPEYRRASAGRIRLDFEPQADKSFNRGFTTYFLHGRSTNIFSFDTPKSMGEEVGYVKEVRPKWLTVAGVKPFANGDGLCYIDEQGNLKGFRVNRVEANKLFPAEMPVLRPRTRLFRNFDQEFERILSRPSAERRLSLTWELSETPTGYALTATEETGACATLHFAHAKEEARSPQADNIRNQLSKLGQTPFEVVRTDLRVEGNPFIPSSMLAEWRRQVIDLLLANKRMTSHRQTTDRSRMVTEETALLPAFNANGTALSYRNNVYNAQAENFYRELGATDVAPAFESKEPADAALMFCRHCLRYSLGGCTRKGGKRLPFREPYYLVSADGRRFRLEFDCKHCQMIVYAAP